MTKKVVALLAIGLLGAMLFAGGSGESSSQVSLIYQNGFDPVTSGDGVAHEEKYAEYEELTENLGGCYIDFMSGEYTINCLEPKAWTDGTDLADPTAPEAFRRVKMVFKGGQLVYSNENGKDVFLPVL